MVAFQSDGAAFLASGDGIFIPAGDLGGLEAVELDAGVAIATRASKVYYAMMKELSAFLESAPDVLGFSVAKSEDLDGDRYGTKTKNYAITITRVSDDRTGALTFPAPANTGIYAGSADFAFTDVFPNAVKVASAATTSGAGVLLLASEFEQESTVTYAALDLASDSRELARALLSTLYSNRALRSDVVASGLVASVYGSQSAAAIPASWYDVTNPRADINADDLRYLALHRVTFTNSIEVIENEDAQTFDVNAIVTPAA